MLWRACSFLIGLLACCGLHAHESPEHEIEALTAKMAAAGKSPGLLARRATEWRALGDLSKAANDLREATQLEPRSTALLTELAKVLIAQGSLSEALTTAELALGLVQSEVDRAPLRMLRAEVHENAGRHEPALADCAIALEQGSPALDWYLTRARLQTRCAKFNECAAGLKEAYEQTGSAVLEIEWIEAMIDDHQYHQALARIKSHLARTRWRGGWLIRRARAQMALGHEKSATSDLRNALTELDRRINPARPDATLIVERGLALALLGKKDAAAKDLRKAKKMGGPISAILRLERALSR